MYHSAAIFFCSKGSSLLSVEEKPFAKFIFNVQVISWLLCIGWEVQYKDLQMYPKQTQSGWSLTPIFVQSDTTHYVIMECTHHKLLFLDDEDSMYVTGHSKMYPKGQWTLVTWMWLLVKQEWNPCIIHELLNNVCISFI